MDILKTVRQEIKKSGESRNQIAINTGIDPAVLCRMMQGGSCKAETADVLLKYFGYQLTKERMKK